MIENKDTFSIGNFTDEIKMFYDSDRIKLLENISKSNKPISRSELNVFDETYDLIKGVSKKYKQILDSESDSESDSDSDNEEIEKLVTDDKVKLYIINHHISGWIFCHCINELYLIFENKDDIELIKNIKIDIGCENVHKINKNFLKLVKVIYDINYENDNKYKIPFNLLFSSYENPFPYYSINYHAIEIIVTFKKIISGECLLSVNYSQDIIIRNMNPNPHSIKKFKFEQIIKTVQSKSFHIKNKEFKRNINKFTGLVSAIIFYYEGFGDLLDKFSIIIDDEYTLGPYTNKYLKMTKKDKTYYVLSFDNKMKYLFFKINKCDKVIDFSRSDNVKCNIESSKVR